MRRPCLACTTGAFLFSDDDLKRMASGVFHAAFAVKMHSQHACYLHSGQVKEMLDLTATWLKSGR